MIRVFTKVDGTLACWEVYADSSEVAIKMVRDDLGVGHKPPILALVKY